MIPVGWTLAAVAVLGLATVFLLYPLALRILPARAAVASNSGSPALPSVSVIVAARNAEALVEAKLDNFHTLDYPRDRIELVLASDGSTDRTVALARARADERTQVLELSEHGGKHVALNEAVRHAQGEVLVLTDVDAILERGALKHLVAPFEDPAIGGVTGRRMIGEAPAALVEAQSGYVALDSGLKALEARRGSVTSNDGKLYAIRRELFVDVPPGVTDDLHTALAVVEQGARFVYAADARAWIRTPSRSRSHELSRRRRIVCRSLRGIYLRRAVLDPRRTGLFALGLATNKVGRRLVPFFLALLLAGSALLAHEFPLAAIFVGAQSAGYVAALSFPWFEKLPTPRIVRRAGSLANYFVLGMAGTLLGVLDFLRGKEVARWDPIKAG